MRNTIFTISAIVTAVTFAVLSCNSPKAANDPVAGLSTDSLLKRGEYLVTVGGCDDCHTPKKMGPMGPEPDMDLRFSGYPATRPVPKFDSNQVKQGLVLFTDDLTASAGPWGVSFAANLTSDDSGLGNWSEQHFFTAIREGKFKGLSQSRPLLPPMPWQNLRHLTDDDLRSIFTFLKSTKPIKNIVPGNKQFAEL